LLTKSTATFENEDLLDIAIRLHNRPGNKVLDNFNANPPDNEGEGSTVTEYNPDA
jgi:hypothetical protein